MAKLERTYRRKFAVHKTEKDYYREQNKEVVDTEVEWVYDDDESLWERLERLNVGICSIPEEIQTLEELEMYLEENGYV